MGDTVVKRVVEQVSAAIDAWKNRMLEAPRLEAFRPEDQGRRGAAAPALRPEVPGSGVPRASDRASRKARTLRQDTPKVKARLARHHRRHTPHFPFYEIKSTGGEALVLGASALPQPQPGDSILVFKEYWMHRVLSLVKTAEVRHRPLKKKKWWIGRGGVITGCATVTNVEHVTDLARWRELLPRHHWDIHKLPYKRTYVNTLEQVGRVNPVPYRKKKALSAL